MGIVNGHPRDIVDSSNADSVLSTIAIQQRNNHHRNTNNVFSSNILDFETTIKRNNAPTPTTDVDSSTTTATRRTKIIAVLCSITSIFFLLCTIALIVIVASKWYAGDSIYRLDSNRNWPLPSGSLHGVYRRAAIATDNGVCSEIGRRIMIRGGNAVDATIASLLCIGVVNPQSSGLGGGFLMTIYNSTTRKCVTIDARETAPASSNATMFVNNSQDSLIGYRSIATPGELHGFFTAYRRFGSQRIAWSDLFQPAIDLCMNGFPVSADLGRILREKQAIILEQRTLREQFVDPITGTTYEEGRIIKRVLLGHSLQLLADAPDPIQLFYEGSMAKDIADEMEQNGGHIRLVDLNAYTSIVDDAIENKHLPHDMAICGPAPPSSFGIMQSIIAVMAEFYSKSNAVTVDQEENTSLIYHRLIESMKFAYSRRASLGDIAFVDNARELVTNMTTREFNQRIASLILDRAQPIDYYGESDRAPQPDHGTSHTSALDADGNGVSCTSTVNRWLGSMRMSPKYGIIWNDEMDDFSTPGIANSFGYAPAEANFISAGKRPMSSMSPAVVYDVNTGKVKLVIGASGGSMIVSATAQSAFRILYLDEDVKKAVDAPRLHNQFLPHVTEYEQTFPDTLINDLIVDRGQDMKKVEKLASVVQALSVDSNGFIHGNSDFRRKTATYAAGF